MPGFTKGPGYGTPFGKNVYLGSTKNLQFDHGTFSADTLPLVTVDGVAQRVLQPGMALARITVGSDAGKLGPVESAGSGADEVQTITDSGTTTAGTYTITAYGEETGLLNGNDSVATVQAAIDALTFNDDITVGGGTLPGTPMTLTFIGSFGGADVPLVTVDSSLLVGATYVPTTTTPGVVGATDGRQTAANYVGICDTFLPTQLLERDVEVAYIYHGTATQAKCFELNAAGTVIALTDTTADALRSSKNCDITFRTASTEL